MRRRMSAGILYKGKVDQVHQQFASVPVSLSNSELNVGNVQDMMAAVSAYRSSPIILSSINIGANAFSQIPYNVVTVTPEGAYKKVGFDNDISSLLEYVNSSTTPTEFKRDLYAWYKLVGACAVHLDSTELEGGKTRLSLHVLNPLWLWVVPSADYKYKSFSYGPDPNRAEPLDRNRVLYMTNFNPDPGAYWQGHTDLRALRFDKSIEHASKRQLANYYERAALVGAVLSSDDEISNDTRERIKRTFQAQHSGAANSHRLLVLDQGMKYENVKSNGSEQFMPDILNSVSKNQQYVLGVPVSLITGEVNNGVELEELMACMYRLTIIPFAEAFGERLTKFLCDRLPVPGTDATRRTSRYRVVPNYASIEALKRNELDQARVDVAFVNSGIKTPNEVRAEHKLPRYSEDLDFGDKPLPLTLSSVKGSASLSLIGVEGGRDQSESGEGAFLDESGKK